VNWAKGGLCVAKGKAGPSLNCEFVFLLRALAALEMPDVRDLRNGFAAEQPAVCAARKMVQYRTPLKKEKSASYYWIKQHCFGQEVQYSDVNC
jgi:hypothetical protein